MYCSNCGVSVPEGIKYCPKCGASIVTLDSQQTQHQSPATRTYESEPCAQNVSYARPQPERRSVGMVPPVLSLVFGSIVLFFVLQAVYYAKRYMTESFAVHYVCSLLSATASIPFGIVGLVKSIKAKCVKGTAISSIGLGLVVMSFCILCIIVYSIS